MKKSKTSGKNTSRKMFVEGLESRTVMAGDCFHNFVLPEDADASGSVTPLDALIVVNRINQSISTSPTNPAPANTPGLVDVDGDAAITPLDALVVIDHLNSNNMLGGAGPHASRVDPQRRIERIEQAIASNALPANFKLEDAQATLDTLRAGGRPELGDHIVNGTLRWHQDENPAEDEPTQPGQISSSDTLEQVQQQRLERFIDSLSKRLEAFHVPVDVIQTISSELLSAYQSGTPLDLTQIRDRLIELGVDVDAILPPAVRPDLPERPQIPQPPQRPDLPTVRPPTRGGLEALQRVMPMLGRLGINRDVALTIYNEARAAAAAGKPLTIDQILARLNELGVSLNGVNLPTL